MATRDRITPGRSVLQLTMDEKSGPEWLVWRIPRCHKEYDTSPFLVVGVVRQNHVGGRILSGQLAFRSEVAPKQRIQTLCPLSIDGVGRPG